MNILDDLNRIQSLDKDDMYKAISGFPEEIKDALSICEKFEFDAEAYRNVNHIILCGMGGSAIGGDLARALLINELDITFDTCRDYNLPRYADKTTLVIGSSYSGNTEETLSAFQQAIDRNCKLFAITTGGSLSKLAEEHNVPTIKPRPGFQPRAALSYSFTLLMHFLFETGYSTYDNSSIMQMAKFLKKRLMNFTIDNKVVDNLTKQLAERLLGRLPIIYSGPSLTAPAALRFKGQICENAKCLAFTNQFPEFNHNELVGWELVDEFHDKLFVVVLRDSDDGERVSLRMDIVESLIAQKEVDIVEIESVGDNKLERLFSLIQVADFTSFYLAILNNVDPTPVKPIEALKRELRT
ncbi:MAG: bifunctional phosphoglucose/phosphomannose isomerase [candidate division Zixibacteria bacterium]|nr:bifunctional phosphoglucose/phosphomannose isomerase [candidate division Zixibacteria bacterium]